MSVWVCGCERVEVGGGMCCDVCACSWFFFTTFVWVFCWFSCLLLFKNRWFGVCALFALLCCGLPSPFFFFFFFSFSFPFLLDCFPIVGLPLFLLQSLFARARVCAWLRMHLRSQVCLVLALKPQPVYCSVHFGEDGWLPARCVI